MAHFPFRHFANMENVTDGKGQLISKDIRTVPALVELAGLKICRNNPTYEGISGGETFDKFRQV